MDQGPANHGPDPDGPDRDRDGTNRDGTAHDGPDFDGPDRDGQDFDGMDRDGPDFDGPAGGDTARGRGFPAGAVSEAAGRAGSGRAGSGRAGSLRLASPAGRGVLACAVLGSGMTMLDATVVNVALPRIGADFDVPLSALQWTITAYMLPLAGLILLGGSLGDRYGRRRIFMTGVAWFAVASVLCGLAPNDGALIAARALQGTGGALLTPGSLALVQGTFRKQDRAKAVGLWSGLGGVATSVGPFLGGWLVDGPGWRWIFYINAPLALAVLLLAVRWVPESRDWLAAGRFDAAGAALAALGLAGITYALIDATGGFGPAVIVALPAGLLFTALFLRREARTGHPMLPLGMFRVKLFTSVNLVTLCLYAAIGGVFFLLPTQLQNGLGYEALAAGVASLPITVLMMLLSGPAGALAQRTGPRPLLTLGPLVAGAGLALLHRVHPGSSYGADVLPAVLVLGLGMSMFVAPLTATVLASVDVRRAGIASGVNNAAARVAQLLAVAALPLAVGLSGSGYRTVSTVDRAFGQAVLVCAGLMVLGAALAWFTVPADVLRPDEDTPHARPQCTVHGAPALPPLEPGARRDPGPPPSQGPGTAPA
ncbi:MFS transporter [Streptomyces sp. NBC_01089]|nr:MFS transporter [Streptomyces sp. NBC_01089]WSU46266.1 MFS transporter [Streptomyces sp. NBC_01089]